MIENKNSLTNLQVNAKCKVCNHWEKKNVVITTKCTNRKEKCEEKKNKNKTCIKRRKWVLCYYVLSIKCIVKIYT